MSNDSNTMEMTNNNITNTYGGTINTLRNLNNEDNSFELIKQKIEQSKKNLLYPSIKFKLPGAILYPENKREVFVYPLLGVHEKKLASINTNKNAINTILEGIASVLEDRVTYLDGSAVNILTLSIQDFLALYFLINFISYPVGRYSTEIKCKNPNCNIKIYTENLKPEFVEIDELKDTFFDDRVILLPYSNLNVILNTLYMKDFIKIFELENINLFKLLIYFIESVDGIKVDKGKLMEILDSLILSDIDVLLEKSMQMLDFGLKLYIKSKCICGHINEVSLTDFYKNGDFKLPFRFY